MSGEITITPGKTFSGDAITDANLNLLGNPTGVVDADSIGSDELIEADVQTIAGAVARGVNYFRNGNFWKDRWQTPAGVSPAAGTRGFNARGWFCRPQGGAVAYARSTTAPSNELSLHSVLLTGASGVSTVEFGQFIPSYLAAQLQGLSITVSFQIKNDTGASLTAVARINVADAEDDEENLTNDTDVNFSAITATEWERVEATFDLSTISNIERGFELVVQLPSGSMNSGTKTVNITQAQLEISSTATAYIHPVDAPLTKHDWTATSDPSAADDQGQGFSIGSEWINVSADRIFKCTDATVGAAVWKLVSKPDVVHLRHVETANTDGDALTTGSWQKRTLNDETQNDNSIATLASSVVTLPAGRYEVVAHVPHHATGAVRARLRNTSDGSDALLSTTGFQQTSTGDSQTQAMVLEVLRGEITITASKNFEVQSWVSALTTEEGGKAANIDSKDEVYTQLWIRRVGAY